MSDNGVLDFIDGADDPAVAERLREAYAALPAASDEQIARCQLAVRAVAMQEAGRRGRFDLSRRWWWGGAAAAALLLVFTFRPERLDDGSRGSVDSATAVDVLPEGSTTIVDGGLAIRFDLRLPSGAQQVALVGDFNGWDSDATLMAKRSADGTWTARIPLQPGVHTYAFVVDGKRWMVDPMAPQVPDAGFGPANAVVVVGSR